MSSPWVDGASAAAQTMEWLAPSAGSICCTELSWCSTSCAGSSLQLPLQGYWLGRKRHHGADCGD